MSRASARPTSNPVLPCPDQLIGTGRLEEVIENARYCPAAEDPRQLALREAQFANAREALLRLLV